MERVANRALGFAAAREWEIRQELLMTPEERFAVAAELKRRAWPTDSPDVRERPQTP